MNVCLSWVLCVVR